MADKLVKVMMPTGSRTGTAGAGAASPPAKRPASLDGKTLYLVDTGFGGSYRFMQQLQQWFRKNLPSVVTVRKRKPGNVFADDAAGLWEEIKAKGDACVIGVGG